MRCDLHVHSFASGMFTAPGLNRFVRESYNDPAEVYARLKQLGLIDKVVNEPLGGAHRDHAAIMVTLKKALTEALRQLQEQSIEALLEAREDKILAYGRFKEIPAG